MGGEQRIHKVFHANHLIESLCQKQSYQSIGFHFNTLNKENRKKDSTYLYRLAEPRTFSVPRKSMCSQK